MKKSKGFTLIEIMIAMFIFAIISILSYKIISSLITTKQTVTAAQKKWGNLAKTINRISTYWVYAIPLTVRDGNGVLQPAMLGLNKLSSPNDSQVEITTAGFIGDLQYGSAPPKRIGISFVNNKLYLITWPYLNRTPSTTPEVELLLENVDRFTAEYLYPDSKWRDTWPQDSYSFNILPKGFKIILKMKSGEEITREWVSR